MSYYNNQIALQLDNKGYITGIIANTFEDIHLQVGDAVIHLFHNAYQSIFFDHFSQITQDVSSVGFRIMLQNSRPVIVFLMRSETGMVLFSISMQEEVLSLFDEMVQINNEQIRTIRELYKKLSTKRETSEFLEEIMLIQNSLINTRRELAHKNRELQRLNIDLETINFTDYLTQLPNRRKFFFDVYRLVQEQDMCLTMMDFNHFKVVNDEFGHVRGDELLVFFAREIKQLYAPYGGVVYRLGGDEFASLVPVQTMVDTEQLIQEIDQKILAFHPLISIAYGTVTLTKETVNEETKVETLMHQADHQMYRKKQAFHQQHGTQTRHK